MAIKLKNNEYDVLKRKIFRRFFGITCITIITVFLLTMLIRGPFGEFTVTILQALFNFGREDAIYFYQAVVRNNAQIIMFITLTISLLFMFKALLNSITGYFVEVDKGMQNLMDHKDISLSPEMAFMELKLNKCKDVIEKREQDARIAEQKKNELVVYLAHDIKTPLTSVVGYLELMNEIPEMPIEQRAKYLNITLEKANRLEQLIDEFFEITRFNLNTIVLNKSIINLTFMLQQISDEFYPMLVSNNNRIVLHIEEDIQIYGDSDKLSRVFNNIIKNAISYCFKESTIVIHVDKVATGVTISFINKGNPIPQHKLDTIFEKFYRLDSSRSSKTGGSGLGLAIAKEIVDAHNGTITVTSDKEATTFIVTLPNEWN